MTDNPYILFLSWALEWATEIEFQVHGVEVNPKTKKLRAPKKRTRRTLDGYTASSDEGILAGLATERFWKTLKTTCPKVKDVIVARSHAGWVAIRFKNNYTNDYYSELTEYCNAHGIEQVWGDRRSIAAMEDWNV